MPVNKSIFLAVALWGLTSLSYAQINQSALNSFLHKSIENGHEKSYIAEGKKLLISFPDKSLERSKITSSIARVALYAREFEDSLHFSKETIENPNSSPQSIAESHRITAYAYLMQRKEPELQLKHFKLALAIPNGLSDSVRENAEMYVKRLSISTGSQESKTQNCEEVVNSINRGISGDELRSQVANCYENAPKLSKRISKAIFERCESKVADFDAQLINTAFTFDESLQSPSPDLTHPPGDIKKIIKNFEGIPLNHNTLLSVSNLVQGLHKADDKQVALEFVASVVKRIEPTGMSNKDREMATIVIHNMEAIMSLDDPKANKIVDEALAKLNAKSVVAPSLKAEYKNTETSFRDEITRFLPAIILAFFIVGLGLIWKKKVTK